MHALTSPADRHLLQQAHELGIRWKPHQLVHHSVDQHDDQSYNQPIAQPDTQSDAFAQLHTVINSTSQAVSRIDTPTQYHDTIAINQADHHLFAQSMSGIMDLRSDETPNPAQIQEMLEQKVNQHRSAFHLYIFNLLIVMHSVTLILPVSSVN
jgi:hypothetical protein